MNGYQYNKNHKIKIFYEINNATTKKYIHPLNSHIKAYVRELSASERNEFNAVSELSDIECVINKRKIDVNMFLEFKGNTYQIISQDSFDFETPEIKIRATQITPLPYETEEGTDWK